MASWLARSVAAGISALAGLAAGVITNVITDEWSLAWGIALAAASVLLVASQIYLSLPEKEPNVSAQGAGSVSSGGSVRGEVDIEVTQSGTPQPPGAVDGIVASGPGSVAARGGIKGRIKIRSRNSAR